MNMEELRREIGNRSGDTDVHIKIGGVIYEIEEIDIGEKDRVTLIPSNEPANPQPFVWTFTDD